MTRNATATGAMAAEDAAEGAAAWVAEEHALLRGINHSFSNRVAAVSALSGVFEPDEAPGQQMTGALANEARRLEALLRTVRLLTGTPGAGAEPVRLSDLLPEVAMLHAQHADFREEGTAIEAPAADVLPVVVSAAALTHALLALLSAAKRAGGGAATLRYDGDERTATVRAVPASGGRGEPADVRRALNAARWLLRDTEARVAEGRDGLEVELITLLEVRRRRAAGG